MIFDINSRKLPSQYGEISIMLHQCIFNCLNLQFLDYMLFKFTCFGRNKSYILAFNLNWHTCQNQSCVSTRNGKIKRFGNYLIYNLIHNNKF